MWVRIYPLGQAPRILDRTCSAYQLRNNACNNGSKSRLTIVMLQTSVVSEKFVDTTPR